MKRLVYGVGVNDKKGYRYTLEYRIWNDMIRRCYSEKLHIKRPSYINCNCSDNFKSFSYFYEWCQKQIGFGIAGYYLDKDILIKGNKFYSEDSCVFVPIEINNLLLNHKARRGLYPLGVNFEKKAGRFRAEMSVNGRKKFLGYYDNPEDAFYAFKESKEKYLSEMAEKYKDKIDPRAYEALKKYSFEIDD